MMMKFLTHLGIPGLTAAVVLAGGGAPASAQTRGGGLVVTPVSNAALTALVRTASGKVKATVGREFSLEVSGRTMTFTVDENTEILTRAGQGTRQLVGVLPIAYFMRSGDVTRVAYRELDGAMRVAEIEIRGRSEIASR
jgi:hypothetical protein